MPFRALESSLIGAGLLPTLPTFQPLSLKNAAYGRERCWRVTYCHETPLPFAIDYSFCFRLANSALSSLAVLTFSKKAAGVTTSMFSSAAIESPLFNRRLSRVTK